MWNQTEPVLSVSIIVPGWFGIVHLHIMCIHFVVQILFALYNFGYLFFYMYSATAFRSLA